jgi:hypothetical protein
MKKIKIFNSGVSILVFNMYIFQIINIKNPKIPKNINRSIKDEWGKYKEFNFASGTSSLTFNLYK